MSYVYTCIFCFEAGVYGGDIVSPCGPDWPLTLSIVLVGFELAILLPQPECQDYTLYMCVFFSVNMAAMTSLKLRNLASSCPSAPASVGPSQTKLGAVIYWGGGAAK